MNHAKLRDRIAAALGVSKADGKKAVDAVFVALIDATARRLSHWPIGQGAGVEARLRSARYD